ncbi:DUF4113 domain-containing protein [Vibrio navarrensis]|nr:DUF4113 domain-containing protein [Vibrio navarrensis]
MSDPINFELYRAYSGRQGISHKWAMRRQMLTPQYTPR